MRDFYCGRPLKQLNSRPRARLNSPPDHALDAGVAAIRRGGVRTSQCIEKIHNVQLLLCAELIEGLRSRLALPVVQLDRRRDAVRHGHRGGIATFARRPHSGTVRIMVGPAAPEVIPSPSDPMSCSRKSEYGLKRLIGERVV